MLPARHFVKYDRNYASEYAVCSALYCLHGERRFPCVRRTPDRNDLFVRRHSSVPPPRMVNKILRLCVQILLRGGTVATVFQRKVHGGGLFIIGKLFRLRLIDEQRHRHGLCGVGHIRLVHALRGGTRNHPQILQLGRREGEGVLVGR